jgi:hypothetical protein
MLTREEAQQLIFTRIKAHRDAGDFFIVEHRTVERPFGWLFFVAVAGSSVTVQREISHRLIIVNKHVEQVIESSIDYTSQRFIKVYENLLGESHARGEDWCLTMSHPFPWKHFSRQRLVKKAKEMGLHEIK